MPSCSLLRYLSLSISLSLYLPILQKKWFLQKVSSCLYKAKKVHLIVKLPLLLRCSQLLSFFLGPLFDGAPFFLSSARNLQTSSTQNKKTFWSAIKKTSEAEPCNPRSHAVSHVLKRNQRGSATRHGPSLVLESSGPSSCMSLVESSKYYHVKVQFCQYLKTEVAEEQ